MAGDHNDIYVVVTAPRSTYEETFNEGGCAYHTYTAAGAIYAVVPYQGDPPLSEGCEFTGNPDGNPVHKTSKSASHELAERCHPFLDTWYARDGEEISDICADENDLEEPDGAWVQNQFDDHLHACSHEDAEPPHVYAISEHATNLGQHEATLTGTVNAEGEEKTSYRFEYGPTTEYGTDAPANNVPLEATSKNRAVQAVISGLPLNASYHFRLVEIHEGPQGLSYAYGNDQKLTTTRWLSTKLATPSPLAGISCPSSASCLAVGGDTVETRSAGQWSATTPPVPGESETLSVRRASRRTGAGTCG